jgi:putative membrane protein
MKETIQLMIKGLFMGIAEAIPGVSGGTIAFITGIYQELIETIKSFTPSNLKKIFSNYKDFWISINGDFLLKLLIGMASGLIFGVLVITHLLDTQQELLWAFFFGLILASAVWLSKDISWTFIYFIVAVLGAVLAYFITGLTPTSGSDHPLYIMLAGGIAITALMLPGISGSFMLLLFGLYHTIMFAVKDIISGQIGTNQIIIVGSFAVGALIGLFSFARVLSYLFKHYGQITMAFLIGILIGSLNKLWPWKIINTAMNKQTSVVVDINNVQLPDKELYKIISESNISPTEYAAYGDPKLMMACVLGLCGVLLVSAMSKMDINKPVH